MQQTKILKLIGLHGRDEIHKFLHFLTKPTVFYVRNKNNSFFLHILTKTTVFNTGSEIESLALC